MKTGLRIAVGSATISVAMVLNMGGFSCRAAEKMLVVATFSVIAVQRIVEPR